MSDALELSARQFLSFYPVRVQTVELVGQSANTVFKVTDMEQKRYSLRLHHSKSEGLEGCWTDLPALRSEMMWLDALSAEAGLVVPIPVKNGDGEWVTVAEGLAGTLLEWVEGEQKPFIPHADDAGRIGRMLGLLHRYASGWMPPESFVRPAFVGERIGQALTKLEGLAEAGQVAAEDAVVLQAAGQRAVAMMDTLGRTPDHWGLIHGDAIPCNLLFAAGGCRLIDFGACGFGYYLFDLGWTCPYIHPSFRKQLLEEYAAEFWLPEGHVELLEGFFVAAQLETMNFWLGLPDHGEWLPGHLARLAAREFARYAAGEPFLYGGTPYWE
ncbi:phosphotransferase enzyme family protein [Paenibacillus mesotrionivorans]|uniref:Phosphotransferase enzyme family protein n=1 Tax=Paenibacillus mesotrionivorans TaxID=3160968 RepID=A0ACC7NYX6_9BACL